MLHLWKFAIRVDEYVIGPDGVQYTACLAVVLAEDAARAKTRLRMFAEAQNANTAWFENLEPQRIPNDTEYVVCWAT